MSAGRQLILLGLEGLDWAFLQALADAGKTPFLASMIEQGAWAPLSFSPPRNPESCWTSAVTGVLPDRHGVLHPAERIGDGIFTRGVQASSCKAPTLWEIADRSGCASNVIGWPATQGLDLAYGWTVAAGVEKAVGASDQVWPIPPDAVAPRALRDDVRASRLHPEHIGAADLEFLIGPLRYAARRAMAGAMAQALAECATLHAIATRILEQRPGGVLALRLDFMARVTALLARVGADPGAPVCLERCYQFLDLVCGRYQHLAGRGAHYAVLSTGSAQRVSGLASRQAAGFAILAGAGVRKDAVLGPVDAADLLPTMLALLELPVPDGLDGAVIADAFDGPRAAMPATEFTNAPRIEHIAATRGHESFDAALLQREGLPVPDFSGFILAARRVECETLFGLAQAMAYRGESAAAVVALRGLDDRFPDFMPCRILLAQMLLLVGRPEEFDSVARSIPAVQAGSVWSKVVDGLTAFARRDWPVAIAAFESLALSNDSPLNAATWLGLIASKQLRWSEALVHFRTAVARAARDGQAWQGHGTALATLGRHGEAAAALGRAASLDPRSADLLIRLADAYERSDQPALAAEVRARAIKIDPVLVARRLAGTNQR